MLVFVVGAWSRKSRTRTLERTRNGFVLSCAEVKAEFVEAVRIPAGARPSAISWLTRLVKPPAGHATLVPWTVQTPKLLVARKPIIALSPLPPVTPLVSGKVVATPVEMVSIL